MRVSGIWSREWTKAAVALIGGEWVQSPKVTNYGRMVSNVERPAVSKAEPFDTLTACH